MLPSFALAAEPTEPAPAPTEPALARDEACPCGSGLDFAACCAREEEGQRRLTRAALARWARARGVEEQLAVLLREVTRAAPGSGAGVPRNVVACLSVAEFLAPPPEYRHVLPSPDRLRLACWAFLVREAGLVREAIAREPLDLVRPAHPGLALLHDRLLELRADLRRRASPRPVRALTHCTLGLDERGLALVFEERRLLGGAAPRGHPAFRLELGRAHRSPLPFPDCPCGSDLGCTHVLAAVDLALSRLADPYRAGEWEGLGAELATPEWSRALSGLRALPPARPARPAIARAGPVQLAFVITRRDGALAVTPWVCGREGQPEARRAVAADLCDRPGTFAPEDRVALTGLGLLRPRAGAGAQARVIEHAEELLALAGHPRVHLEDAGSPPAAVEPAELGLVARPAPGGGVEVVPVLDGRPVAIDVLRRQLAGLDRERAGAFAWLDPARRVCLVVSCGDLGAASVVLASLARVDGRFPPEAEEGLLEQLDVLRAIVPVTISPELEAEEVPPRPTQVLRLSLGRGGLRVELLARPLEAVSPQPPGAGPGRLLATHDGRRRAARRDLSAERAAADALGAALGLAPPRPGSPYTWELSDDAEAFAFVERLGAAGRPDLGAAVRPDLGAAVRPDLGAAMRPDLEVEWVERPARCATASAVRQLRVELHERNDWFGLEGSIELEGVQIELALLLRALREGRRVVRLGTDGWLRLTDALAERLLALGHAAVPGPGGGLEVGLGAAGTLSDLARDGATLDLPGRLADLVARLASAEADPALPEGFRGALRPYQHAGFRWLARLSAWAPGAVLADDMGLGKTLQALALLCRRAPDGPALVLAPTSVCANWAAEAARFAPGLRVTLYRDAGREEAVRALGPGDVLVASYGLVTTHAACFEGVRLATLVLDEAQAIKNAATRRAHTVRGLAAGFTLALSGTPIENHLGELWSLFRTVFPRLLGSWEAFRDRFAAPIEAGRDEGARRALAATLRPFLLRRTKAEVAPELPGRTEIVLPVQLSPGEQALYEETRLAVIARLGARATPRSRAQRRILLLAALTELRLLACHPRLRHPASTLPSAKLDRFLELVPELCTGGHRTLVFSQFTRHLALVREALDRLGRPYLYLDGQTPPAGRDALVRRFQAGEGELFLVSLRAGGSGLNLTGADYVVHLDPWWNPAVEDQATDRAHRIGQTRPVTVYRLIAAQTIEEELRRLQDRKRALVDGVLEGMAAADRLSDEDLLALLTRAPRRDEAPRDAAPPRDAAAPRTPPPGSPRGG